MTTVQTTDMPAADVMDVLEAAAALTPVIEARASEIEAARRVPLDLVDQLADIGCFRVLLPRSHGGVESTLPTALRLFESLAAADGSVGWTVMIGASAWCDVSGLARPAFDVLYAERRHTILAGAFNPTSASIVPEGDGYRVHGRWGFASGCQHAAWMFGNCIEGILDGRPMFRIAVFSPDEVTIEDTWHVSGLAGSGSHHFSVDGVFVPAERTFRPMVDPSCLDAAIVRVPPPSLISLCVASVAVGIADGALADITALAAGKVPLLAHAPLAANPLFQFELARADTDVRAARALLHETADATWATAEAGDELTADQRARIRAAAVWATERAVAAVEAAYRAGGGSSLYLECPLQRRLRDVHALTQHFLVRRDALMTAGAVFAGVDADLTLF